MFHFLSYQSLKQNDIDLACMTCIIWYVVLNYHLNGVENSLSGYLQQHNMCTSCPLFHCETGLTNCSELHVLSVFVVHSYRKTMKGKTGFWAPNMCNCNSTPNMCNCNSTLDTHSDHYWHSRVTSQFNGLLT